MYVISLYKASTWDGMKHRSAVLTLYGMVHTQISHNDILLDFDVLLLRVYTQCQITALLCYI